MASRVLQASDAVTPGIEQLLHLERLPLQRPQVRVHYEGSIDKRGKNADWDWWLYQDATSGEWVICEAEGPGCLWNFVVHHALGHSDPVYRFYLDGDPAPAFEIRHSEFGRKAPFVAPLADEFVPDTSGDARLEQIDFRIVRSFCPMPFRRGLRITSSVKLEGDQTTGGGWGHAIWHSYPDATGLTTFTGREEISPLLELWRSPGQDPKPVAGAESARFQGVLPPGQSLVAFQVVGEGSLTGISLAPLGAEALREIWIKLRWENEPEAAVECPLGAFFGNEFGYHRLSTLLHGARPDGTLYSYWPMPFWESATVELENRGDRELSVRGDVTWKPAGILAYPREHTGHFRASPYQPMTAKVVGRDSQIAHITGRGHMVAGLVTALDSMCEGDARIHIDGCGTPAVESDGSESWICYGWGFEFPPQVNPASSYDGRGNSTWSMSRLLMGDCYPFRSELRLTVEGGNGDETGTDQRSGLIFWYGEPEPAMTLSDTLTIGDPLSEAAHRYEAPGSTLFELTSSLEGEFDDVPLTGHVRTVPEFSEFTVQIEGKNAGLLLRRRSDQGERGQRARIFIDGQEVTERTWLNPDQNPHFRWLEDDFLVPARLTAGKTSLTVRLTSADPAVPWNESTYWVYSLLLSARRDRRDPAYAH